MGDKKTCCKDKNYKKPKNPKYFCEKCNCKSLKAKEICKPKKIE